MRTMTVFRALAPVDARNVQRDAMLFWLPLLPLILALVLRLLVPEARAALASHAAFDLRPYEPLIASFYLLMTPSIAGMLVGFLLLDERDDRTLLALLVTPLSLGDYLLYRISVPMVGGSALAVACYGLTGLVALPFGTLLLVAGLASFVAPLLALALAAIAENKVAGFALLKGINGLSLVPIAAYFFPAWEPLAWLVPTFWPMKLLWLAAAGQPLMVPALVGLAVNGAALGLAARHLRHTLHR